MTPAFFVLAFALAWIPWIAVMFMPRSAGPAAAAAQVFLLYLGVFAPALVAIALTARADGRAGVNALLGRIFQWRVQARWYVLALGYMATVKLAVAVAHRAVLGEWPVFGSTPWYVMVGAIGVSMWAQAGEEVGWRGYALPRLAARFGLAGASILLGILWAVWHLPLFYMYLPGSDNAGQSFPLFVIQVTAISVAIAWLYWKTNGSLLLPMLMHASINNTKDIVPSVLAGATDPMTFHASPVGWLTVVFLWIGAIGFLASMLRDPGATRSRTQNR